MVQEMLNIFIEDTTQRIARAAYVSSMQRCPTLSLGKLRKIPYAGLRLLLHRPACGMSYQPITMQIICLHK